MPRSPNPVPSVILKIRLPEDVHAQAHLLLYSPLEQKIPYAAWSNFIVARLREWFGHKELDLAPWLETQAGACVVRGSPESIRMLTKILTEAV